MNVMPLMTASVDPTSVTDIPPATPNLVSVGCAVIPPSVVPSNETPFGPIVIVSPSTSSVTGADDGPKVKVWPSMTAKDDPMTEKILALMTTTFEGELVGGDTVVCAKPSPAGPIDMVCPSATIVVSGAPGPMEYVIPLITADDGDIWTGTPAIVVCVGAAKRAPVLAGGMATVLPPPITCDGLIVKTWPSAVTMTLFPPEPVPPPPPPLPLPLPGVGMATVWPPTMTWPPPPEPPPPEPPPPEPPPSELPPLEP